MRPTVTVLGVGMLCLLTACHDPAPRTVTVVDRNGRPFIRSEQVDGEKQGRSTILHPNGTVRKEGWYDRDLREGAWIERSPLGDTLALLNYDHGRLDGTSTWWNDEGQVTEQAHYRQGVRDGDMRRYFADGSPRLMLSYRDGKPEGPYRRWFFRNDETGSLRIEGYYHNGVSEGIWTTYRSDGTIASRGRFINGQRVGTWVRYAPEGALIDSVIYDRGRVLERHGPGTSR